MPHHRSRSSSIKRRLRYRIIEEVRRRSIYDREVCERIVVEPIVYFDKGEILYGVRYLNPVYERIIRGDLYKAG
ncbi:MAG: hypothetical protein QW374_04880 [Candidatus Bathyarchaeia archaeon]|nr:hypothetical protein [Candidatus Bathyarchaeota archaeon]